MIENALTAKKVSTKTKITVKGLISLLVVALAVVLPQIAHLVAGAQSGIMLLPMYLPVLVGACLLGVKWGVCVGIASPLASYLVTSALSDQAMPALVRLPFMMAELAVFAVVAGLFCNKIAQNAWWTFAAVAVAAVAGRSFFMLSVVVFQNLVPFTPSIVLQQIQTGFVGLAIQIVVVPAIVGGLKMLLDDKDNNND